MRSGAAAIVGTLVLVTSFAISPSVRAQSTSVSATADALFREGRAAFSRGDFATALKLLAESERLSPAPGTRLNLALAEEKLGRLLSAWEHARSALDQLEPADARRPIADDLFRRLDPRVPRLKLTGGLPPGAEIKLDGIKLAPSSLGVPLPVDVGTHRIVVSAPDHEERSVTQSVSEGERAVVALTLGPKKDRSRDAPPPGVAGAPRRDWPRAVGWISVAVGAASLVGSGVTGFLALQKNQTVTDRCDDSGCDQAGLDAAQSGRTLATVSTILGATGVGFVVGGVTVLLVVPPSPAAAREVRTAGAVISTAF